MVLSSYLSCGLSGVGFWYILEIFTGGWNNGIAFISYDRFMETFLDQW